MDKRIIIIAILGVTAAVLLLVNESGRLPGPLDDEHPSSGPAVTAERVEPMADTTLRLLGVAPRNIRPVRGSNDVRVAFPERFDVLQFIIAMQDSLSAFDAVVTSSDNSRENVSVVQIKHGDAVVKSYVFRKEPVTKKGAAPSVRKQTKRQ
jgi:hypothetical protein